MKDQGIAPVFEMASYTEDTFSLASKGTLTGGLLAGHLTVPEDETWEVQFASISATTVGTSTHTIKLTPKQKITVIPTTFAGGASFDADGERNITVKEATGVASGVSTVFEPNAPVVLGPGDSIYFAVSAAAAGDIMYLRVVGRRRKLVR
ncbi:MAG TPA: hypothetical protein VNX21_03715 [Candidatus Thermoplasmatota archaeon]|nr:hypothetical protein [Candidatus Thermoplasmatota archaeon]